MKLTVLGRWGAYPAPGEATSGYLLETDRHKVLVDCGSGVLANLFKLIRQEELDALFLSHYHYDHSADLGCLQYAMKIAMGFKRRSQPLPIYGNNRSSRYSELSYREYTVGKEIHPDTIVDLSGLKVTFYQTVHEEYNLAMRFEYEGKVLVYTGDLGPATQIAEFCKGADLLICETSLFEHEEGLFPGHMTTKQAGELAEKAGVKELLLTHFPHIGEIQKMPSEAAKYFQGQVWPAEINKSYGL
ncbi:MAG: MBL fold metallo-hydrolase [Peptococcaceae bacterium]|nr:MBL fold metallo-hydrolase [Peptococcaceae bacterium]